MTRQIETQNNQSPQRAYPDAHFHPYADDEISLVDLGKVLYKRLWVIILVGALVSGAALAYALMQKPNYRYLSILELGSYIAADGEERLIENKEASLARLRNAIYPGALRQLVESYEWDVDQAARAPGVELRLLDDSPLIVMSTTVSTQTEPEMMGFLEDLYGLISERMILSHARLIANQIRDLGIEREVLQERLRREQEATLYQGRIAGYEAQILEAQRALEQIENDQLAATRLQSLQTQRRGAQRELDTLRQQAENIRAAITLQDEKAQLLRRQIERAENDLMQLRASRRQMDQPGQMDSQLVSSLMVIDSQILSSQNALRGLEQTLSVGLIQETAELNANLVSINGQLQTQESRLAEAEQALREYELMRPMLIQQARAEVHRKQVQLAELDEERQIAIVNLQQQLNQLENRLDRIRNTEIEVAPFQELQPESSRKALILALGLVLGGILGIMAAFFAEFGARVRQSLKEDQQV